MRLPTGTADKAKAEAVLRSTGKPATREGEAPTVPTYGA